MENKIISLIERQGPLTGSEILETVGGDGLILWRACRLSKILTVRTVGTRYLRLDRKVEGFARLSPSILREFLTFSVVGIQGDSSRRTDPIVDDRSDSGSLLGLAVSGRDGGNLHTARRRLADRRHLRQRADRPQAPAAADRGGLIATIMDIGPFHGHEIDSPVPARREARCRRHRARKTLQHPAQVPKSPPVTAHT